MVRIIFSLLLVIAFSTSAFAAEKWFQGYVNNDWNLMTNWDGGVPIAGDDVRIFAPCILDNDNSITLNSLQVGSGGDFTLTVGDEIIIDNTIDKSYLTYALDIFGNATINGSIKIVNSVDGGARLGNVVLNGSIEIDNITIGVAAAYLYNFTLNGNLHIGDNLSVSADYSLYIGENFNINASSSLTIEDLTRRAIVVNSFGILTINEVISFPNNISKTCIESDGIILNYVELDLKTDGSSFSPAFINRGTFTNYGQVNFPLTANYSWRESGNFINEECAFIKLEGRLYCVNKVVPNPYATITNRGIIHSTFQGLSNHYYGGNHTFNNQEGIAVDAKGKFSAAFDTNTGAKTQFLGFSNCGSVGFDNFYEGSLTNVTSGDLFLDTMLTMPAGVYDAVNNQMNLAPATIGVNKFFVQITDANAFCSIITPILLDDFLEITPFYADSDTDNFGDATEKRQTCALSISGYVTNDDDCNDSDPAINPSALEVCDGIDSNCDGIGDNPGEEETLNNTFNGTIDSDWYKPGNWSENIVPNFCTEVIIADGKIASLLNFPDTIQGLYIEANARLNISDNLNIYPIENNGLFNEGLLYGPDFFLNIDCINGCLGIENHDSIYLGGITLKNITEGIYNYEDAGIETHNLEMDMVEFVPISNVGIIQLTKASAPKQSFISLSNLEEEGIQNDGTLIWGIDYSGGNESENSLQSLIYNGGQLIIESSFSYFSQNGDEGIQNEGSLIISGDVYLPGTSEFNLDGEAGEELILKTGGKLTLSE